MDTDAPQAQKINTVRALATLVQQRLHLLTQSDRARNNAARAVQGRMHPLALTRALSFLRGLKQWLPVSWRPDALQVQKDAAHDSLHLEYRHKRPATKQRARRVDAHSLPELESDEKFEQPLMALEDHEITGSFNDLYVTIEQIETLAQSLDPAPPNVENENARDELLTPAFEHAPTEPYTGDLAAQYIHQLGLAALTPLVPPRASAAHPDSNFTPVPLPPQNLTIIHLDFAPDVESHLPTLVPPPAAASQTNRQSPRDHLQNERVLRAPQPRTQNRAPAPSHANAPIPEPSGVSSELLAIHAETNIAAETDHAALANAQSASPEAESPPADTFDSLAAITHQFFAGRMNLSASLAPDGFTFAQEITQQYAPPLQENALTQISLPRMFEESVSQPQAGTSGSESASPEASPEPALPNPAPTRLEMRAGSSPRISSQTTHPLPPPSLPPVTGDTSTAYKTQLPGKTENTKTLFVLPGEPGGALSLHTNVTRSDASDAVPQSQITPRRAAGADSGTSFPPFRLSDEIRVRVASFPNLELDTAQENVSGDRERAGSPERFALVQSPRGAQFVSAHRVPQHTSLDSNSMLRPALSFGLVSAPAFPGNALNPAWLPQRVRLAPGQQQQGQAQVPQWAHRAAAQDTSAPYHALNPARHEFQFEHADAEHFAVSLNAHAETSPFVSPENDFGAASALFRTIAQPSSALAWNENGFGKAAANVSPRSGTFAPSAPVASNESIKPSVSQRTANPARQNPLPDASNFSTAPNMDLRNAAGASIPAAQTEPESSPGVWRGSLADSLVPEPSASRTNDYAAHAGQNDSSPGESSRNPLVESAPARQAAAPPLVDVNALAQQVYALLKTQLRAERERHQLYHR